MKETKNVPQLRFSGFDDDWEEKKLNNYLEVSTEKNFDNLFTKENVLSVSGEFGVVNQIAFQGRSFAGASLTNYKISDLESVIYTKSPLNATPYGIIKANKFEKGIVSVLYAVYKTNNSDSKFIQDYFNLDERLNNYLRPLISKGAKNTINVSDLEALEGIVTFPSLSEQQKIGTFLSHIDSLIQAKTKKLESLKAIKKSLLQKCFPKAGEKVPEMRFAGFSGDWEEKRLGEIITEIKRTDEKSNAPVMMITAENGFINQSDRYSFNNAGQSLKKYIVLEKFEMAYNHGASKLRPFGSSFALITEESARIPYVYHCFSTIENPEFLSLVLNGKNTEDQLRKIVTSGARMDGLLNISFLEFSSIYVLIPPTIKEQEKIANFFSKYDSLISAQQKEINKLKDIKKSLLQKMFV